MTPRSLPGINCPQCGSPATCYGRQILPVRRSKTLFVDAQRYHCKNPECRRLWSVQQRILRLFEEEDEAAWP